MDLSYFLILKNAAVFSLTQALLAAFISSFMALSLSFCVALSLRKNGAAKGFFFKVHKVLSFFSKFLFALPGVTTAFLFLFTIESFGILSLRSGLWAIVTCHVIFSIGWVFFDSLKLFERKLNGPFLNQIEAASVLGANMSRQFKGGPLSNLFKQELFYYLVFLFFIYFNSFSVALILGGSPKYSTLDVLNFFNILQNAGYERIVPTLLLQLTMGLFLAWLFSKKFKNNIQFPAFAPEVEKEIQKFQAPVNLGFSKYLNTVSILSVGFFIFLFGAVIFGVLGILKTLDISQVMNADFLWALKHSLNLIFAVALVYGFFVLSTRFFDFRFMGSYSQYFLGVSPFVISITCYSLLDAFSLVNTFPFLCAGLTLFLSLGPWLAYAVSTASQRCPQIQIEAAENLGATRIQIIRKLLAFYIKPTLQTYLFFMLLMAAADVFVSGLMLGDFETLSLLGRRWAQRYNFDGMALIVFIQLVLGLGLESMRLRYES